MTAKYLYKFINDNLYGGIGFSEQEFEIINTPTFQRLRRIKQQGLTSYTFPCSDHTRFSHALGVMYIMGRMAYQLLGQGALTEREYELLRLAALLHDIGHYPFSHLTESVYRMRVPEPVETSDTNTASPLIRFSHSSGLGHKGHHEQLGVEVIKNRKDILSILRKAKIDPDELGEIITGETTNKLYHQLMHSSLDCDRLDYLLRDSSSAGVVYGQVDLDYLIRSLAVGEDEIEFGGKVEKNKCIGIRIKGLHGLEHYLMARYFSYSQITMHKTTSVFETLAKALIWRLAEEGEIYPDYESILDIIKSDAFLDFDDYYIYRAIKNSKTLRDDKTYKKYRDTLLKRNRIKVSLEKKLIEEKNSLPNYSIEYYRARRFLKDHLEKVASNFELDVACLGYMEQVQDIEKAESELNANPMKYYESARVIDNDGKCTLLAHTSSSLVRELFNKQLRVFRLFYIDPHFNNKKKSDELASLVRDFVCQQAGVSC